MSDFVLIHWTGEAPTCWQRLSTALAFYGHRAHAVDLPVDRPELRAGDYANIMREQVDHITNPIVLGTLWLRHPTASGLKDAKSTTSSLACRVGAKLTRQLYGGGAGKPGADI